MRYRHAALVLGLVIVGFFAQPLFRGAVIYPHDNTRELGLPPDPTATAYSNRKFSDESSQFIPELHHHLNGNASGWISTWNPHVELGRPTQQVGAAGPAFWPTRLAGWLSQDALRVYTLLSMAAVGLTCFAALLWLRARGIAPAAGLAAALGIGLGTFSAYWLTFGLFLWGLGWTLVALWLVERSLRQPTLLRGVGLAVAIQGLLLSGYPQQTVWHAGILAAYSAFGLVALKATRGETLRRGGFLLGWAVLGVACAAPVYADLAENLARSARVAPPASFFTAVLPALTNVQDGGRFLAQLVEPGFFGNPSDPAYPLRFNGLSFAPLCILLVAASFSRQAARTLWPWQAFVAAVVGLTLAPPLYAALVKVPGFGISRFLPLAAALIPLALLAGHGADRLLREPARGRGLAIGVGLGWLAVLGVAVATGPPLATQGLVCAALSLSVTLAFALRPSAGLLCGAALATVALHAWPLALWRPPHSIQRTSPLVEAIRQHTPDGFRYAWVDQAVIPSNQEAWLGLDSIHTYNSLSSLRYQAFVLELSAEGTTERGRYFRRIRGTDRLTPDRLRTAGVGALISASPIDPALARPVGRVGRLRIYRTVQPPISALHRSASGTEPEGTVAAERVTDDRWRLRLEPAAGPGLVLLSQQYHPRWRAHGSEGELETLEVDGFYQGIRVPADVREIDLRFQPWVRFAWIPQLGLGILLVGAGLRQLLRSSRDL